MSLLAALNLRPPQILSAAAAGAAVRAGQHASDQVAGPVDPEPEQLPDATVAPMPPIEMKDEDIAAAIMDKQISILVGWQTALQVFDKTMTSSADAEATPQFQKVIVGYFADKLMSAIVKHTPGVKELDGLVSAIEAEYSRAAAAGASATLRDFVVQHAKSIGKLHQKIWDERQGFISAVNARREALAATESARARKGARGRTAAPSKEDEAYSMMRMTLLDTLDNLHRIRAASTEEILFRVLTEEWLRHATSYAGMAQYVKGVVRIRLNPDYSVKDAYIEGRGGQKLAEQLLKDSPAGVDVFRLKARRRIILLDDDGKWTVALNLDENNRNLSRGAGEGDTGSVRQYVMSKGLPPTTKLTGD